MRFHRTRLPMTLASLGFAVLIGCGGGEGGGEGGGTPTPSPSEPSFEELVHLFDYDQEAPIDLHYVTTTTQADAEVHQVYYPSPKGGTVTAYLVVPLQDGPYAGVVFLHWNQGNRGEFLWEAVELARRGVASLSLDAPWETPDPPAMTQDDMYIREVVDARRAVDVLTSRPDVDVARLGYVGHSNGAIFGAVLAGVERRIRAYVLMTGYARPSVYYPDNLAPSPRLDAIHYIGHAAPSALLFQFGTMDPNISEAVAMEFYDAASEPKFIAWYDTGHGLNEQARVDRADWLAAQLALEPAR